MALFCLPLTIASVLTGKIRNFQSREALPSLLSLADGEDHISRPRTSGVNASVPGILLTP